MGEAKSVVIKLTNEQRDAIKKATGQEIAELKVEAMEGRESPFRISDATARKAPWAAKEETELRKAPFGGGDDVTSRKAPFGGGDDLTQRKAPFGTGDKE